MKQTEIIELINVYRERVFVITSQLGAHFGLEGADLLSARNRGDIPASGEFAGQRFYFHGVGLAIRTAKRVVDFDWGPNNELGGFDASRLCGFSMSNKPFCKRTPPGYPEDEIEEALLRMEQDGHISKRGPGLGDHLYFLC